MNLLLGELWNAYARNLWLWSRYCEQCSRCSDVVALTWMGM